MAKEYRRDVSVISQSDVNTDPFFFDDFEGSLIWSITESGNDDAIGNLSSVDQFGGKSSLRLSPSVLAPSSGDETRADLNIGNIAAQYVSFGFWFNIDGSSDHEIELKLLNRRGDFRTDYGFRIRTGALDDDIKLLNSSDSYEKIADLVDFLSNAPWNHVELIIDTENNEYADFKINGNPVDMKDVSPYDAGSTASNYTAVEIFSRAKDTVGFNIFVDNFRVVGFNNL